jgi:hypothetical protein
MSVQTAIATVRPGRVGRSIAAIAAALVANATASLAIDQLFYTIDVYPPWGQPMYEPELNLLALSYRIVLGIGAGWLVARLAPSAPVRHANVLGVIATVLSTLGAIFALTQKDFGPAWYPIALALLSYPTVRLGAAWHERQ